MTNTTNTAAAIAAHEAAMAAHDRALREIGSTEWQAAAEYADEATALAQEATPEDNDEAMCRAAFALGESGALFDILAEGGDGDGAATFHEAAIVEHGFALEALRA